MSPIFQAIPDEAKCVKRTTQVIEPLQVIPEDEELDLKVEHVSKSEHLTQSHATLSTRRFPTTVVHHHPSSESLNPCVYQFPFIRFPKSSQNEFFNPTSCFSSTQFGK
jgi:hypothetical protein